MFLSSTFSAGRRVEGRRFGGILACLPACLPAERALGVRRLTVLLTHSQSQLAGFHCNLGDDR